MLNVSSLSVIPGRALWLFLSIVVIRVPIFYPFIFLFGWLSQLTVYLNLYSLSGKADNLLSKKTNPTNHYGINCQILKGS